MNKFEQYLNENREALKPELKDDGQLWNRLQFDMERRKTRKYRRFIGIAASLALILASASFLFQVSSFNRPTKHRPLYAYSASYGQIEDDFVEVLSYEQERLLSYNYNDKDLLESYNQGLRALEEAYREYVKIVEKDGCSELMMKLIIQNYEQRLEILKSIEQLILKGKSDEKYSSI